MCVRERERERGISTNIHTISFLILILIYIFFLSGCGHQDHRPGGGRGRDRRHPAGDHGPQPVRQSLHYKILWLILKGELRLEPCYNVLEVNQYVLLHVCIHIMWMSKIVQRTCKLISIILCFSKPIP